MYKLVAGVRSGGTVYELDNVAVIAQENPYSFYLPSSQVISQLKPGDHAKLMFLKETSDQFTERMWVQITSIDGDTFTGKLDNDPHWLKLIKCGDEVTFEACHIMDTTLNDPVAHISQKYTAKCVVTNRVMEMGECHYLDRTSPMDEQDSGFAFIHRDDTQEDIDDPLRSQFISIGRVLDSLHSVPPSLLKCLATTRRNGNFEKDSRGAFKFVRNNG